MRKWRIVGKIVVVMITLLALMGIFIAVGFATDYVNIGPWQGIDKGGIVLITGKANTVNTGNPFQYYYVTLWKNGNLIEVPNEGVHFVLETRRDGMYYGWAGITNSGELLVNLYEQTCQQPRLAECSYTYNKDHEAFFGADNVRIFTHQDMTTNDGNVTVWNSGPIYRVFYFSQDGSWYIDKAPPYNH